MLGIDHLDDIDFFFLKNNKYFNTNTIRGEKILKKTDSGIHPKWS